MKKMIRYKNEIFKKDLKKIEMWFYLYLITTSFHYQNGLSLIGLSTNYAKDHMRVCQTYEYSDQLKYIIIYQFPENMIVHPILDIVTNNSYDKNVEWYNVDIDEIEFNLHKFGITFNEITIKDYMYEQFK